MAGIPKVKIQFDADLDGLKKGTAQADTEIGGFADRVSDFGKKAAAAFALAGAAAAAYAGKLLVDGVKSAIEDEAAQAKLAGTLERVAGASKETVKAVEDYITKTALATGVADDKLRPALDRLVRSTGDAGKAQEALNLALNISAATGKSLETVTAAVGKALDGNATSLGKVAGGFEASELKGKSFSDLLPILTERFGAAAQEQADTFAGKVARLGVAFDEAKETVGAFILDAITPLITNLVDVVIPAVSSLAESIGSKLSPVVESATKTFTDNILPALQSFYTYLTQTVIPSISSFVIPVFNALRGAVSTIGQAFKDQEPNIKSILDVFKSLYSFLNLYIIPILTTNLVAAIKTFATAASAAIRVVLPVVEAVLSTIEGVIDVIVKVINGAINIYNKLNNLFGGKDIKPITGIGSSSTSGTSTKIGGVELPFGGANVGGLAGNLGGVSTGGLLSGIGSAVGGAVGSAVGGTLTKAVQTLPKTLIEQVTEENAFKLIPPSDFNVARFRQGEENSMLLPVPSVPKYDLAAFRQGEEVGNTYNINVSGAIDPESTARQIVTLLNDSQARGTLGAGAFAT